MTPPARAEMMELLDCACGGQLVEAQSARLQHLLLGNAEARAMYIDYMVLHAGIAWRFRDRDNAIEAAAAAGDGVLDGHPPREHGPQREFLPGPKPGPEAPESVPRVRSSMFGFVGAAIYNARRVPPVRYGRP